MAQENIYLYPLPFPNDDQRMQVASLGTHSRNAIRHKRARGDAAIETCDIYLNQLPVSNPSYPYPARNIFNPGTHLGASYSASNRRNLDNASVVLAKDNDQKELSTMPSRYDRLPQPHFVRVRTEFHAIRFLRKGAEEPYTIGDLLTMDTMPDLVAGDSPILIHSPDRLLKIKLIWPGYSRYPFEKRISIKKGAPLTSSLLLVTLANHINQFVRWIQNEGAIIEPGQERWGIVGVTKDAPATWKKCIITSLQHREGSIWQLEIYYPRNDSRVLAGWEKTFF